MTREEAKKAAEIMLAYADGKEIEFRSGALDWDDIPYPNFDWDNNNYRIKSETEYRHFNSGDECWKEMKRHEPFGWICDHNSPNFKLYVLSVDNDGVMVSDYDDGTAFLPYSRLFYGYNFVDGTRCGIITKNEK